MKLFANFKINLYKEEQTKKKKKEKKNIIFNIVEIAAMEVVAT